MNPVRLTPQQRFRLRRQLRTTDDLGTYRRTLSLLELDRGSAVTEVAIRLGVSRRTVHGWIATYRHHPVPGSLVTHHSTGRPPEWDEDAQAILRASLDQPPDHFGYRATAWTIPLLQSHLAHWGLTGFCDATVRRQLHALGYVWKRPRYVLDPDPHRAAKMRRIRQYLKGLGPRDVVLFEDETDLLLFPPLRACWARRGRRRGPPERCQREAGALRRTQPVQWDAAVPGAEEAVERRLPGVPRADPSAVPRMAGVAGFGRGQ